MPFTKLIAFDRPLSGAAIVARAGQISRESEMAAHEQEAYRRGVDAARALADQQMVEARADIEQLSDGILQKLSRMEPQLFSQLREALPGLAVEIARRLLAGYEPTPEIVSKVCEEALGELFPERENLELAISAHDAALLEKITPEWKDRYPGLRIRAEATFGPGDCQVRSRFGVTDARLQTKLTALEHSLSHS
ncbi:MAG TPA: FliH/SctL family protein [Opitutaceae bacterium]|nr:FliH/SctL family protein [Opitutaceae bacterium]